MVESPESGGSSRITRRRGLAALAAAGAVGLSGCSLRRVTDGVTPRWERSFSGATEAGPPAATPSRVVVGAQDRSLHGFTVDGDRVFRVETGGPVVSRPAVPATGGPVHAHSTDGDYYTVAANGERLWHAEGRDRHARLAHGGSLFVAAEPATDTVTGYDATTGAVRFRRAGWSYPAPVVDDGLCLLPPADDATGVLALDPETGVRLWASSHAGLSAVAAGDGRVVTLAGDTVWSHRARDGWVRWTTTLAETARRRLAVDADGVYAATTHPEANDELVALDRNDGTVRWRQSVGFSLETITTADGRVFVGSTVDDPDGGISIRLDAVAADGTRLWDERTSLTSGGRIDRLTRVGRLLVVSNGSTVGAYDPATGGTRWRYSHDSPRLAVAVAGDTLFVSHRDTGGIARLPVV